jgi:hypothetical protein
MITEKLEMVRKANDIGGDDLYTYNMAYATMGQILTRLRHAPEVRERFVSGTCPDCWEATFSPIGGK